MTDPLPTHLLASQNVHAMPRWCKLHVQIDVKQIFSLVSGVDSFGVLFSMYLWWRYAGRETTADILPQA